MRVRPPARLDGFGSGRNGIRGYDSHGGAGNATQRAVTKANHLYSNAEWDLVDAVTNKRVDLKALQAADLPAKLARLSVAARQAFVAARARERAEIQARINALNRERNQFIEQQRTQSTASDTLDVVMAQALRDQAACRGIQLQ